MLNVGLIGDIQLLDPFLKKAREHPEIYITGKSSVGTSPQPGNSRVPEPEFNRIELIERSDILFINRFSLLPFHLLCDIVKKSKHIFATSYPKLSVDECSQLAKLAHEAKTVIQITNPFYYLPAIQWLNQNLKKPAFTEVSFFRNEELEMDVLFQLLLMLKDAAGISPKKAGAVSFQSTAADSVFNNLHLEFGDGSVVTVNYGKMGNLNEFKIKTFAHEQFTNLNFSNGKSKCNNSPVDLTRFKKEFETSTFIRSILQKKHDGTSIEDYSSVLQTVKKINLKLDRFSTL